MPESLWHGRKVFALRVRGQSMIDAGIRDGDYLIVEPARDGGRRAHGGGRDRRPRDGEEAVPLPQRPGAPAARQSRDAAADHQRRSGAHPRRRRRRAAQVSDSEPAPATRRGGASGGRRRRRVRRAARRPMRETLDLSLNAIDAQLERWRMLGRAARRGDAARANGRDMAHAGARPAGAARVVRAHHQAGAAPRASSPTRTASSVACSGTRRARPATIEALPQG